MNPKTELQDPPEELKKQQQRQPEKKFTRQERRIMERREIEARQTFDNMAARFLEFFTDAEDPEGQEVADKIDQLSAQWKVYCHRKNLKKEAHPLVENYCKAICEEYLKTKAKPQPEPAQ